MSKEVVTRVEFTVADKMVIADPCYIDENDTLEGLGSLGVILEGCAGDWMAEVEISDEGSWGDRVSVLRATRRGHPAFTSAWEHLGDNGVDSGQMFIGCVSSFPLDYDAVCERYKLPNGEWDNNLNLFAFAEGAISKTGMGDGCYPVYVQRDVRGNPVTIEIRFFEDADEE